VCVCVCVSVCARVCVWVADVCVVWVGCVWVGRAVAVAMGGYV
jgi:hypothetical protein